MKLDYRGILVPMVTPFRENGDLDETALRKLTDFLIDKGIHILFPAGSTGEGWALTREERKRAFQIVIEQAAGRVPVYAGTGAVSTREAVYLTKMAEDCGANAVVVITPFYIAPNSGELYDHYAAIADATTLPVFPYNNPSRTGVPMTVDLVERLAKINNIAGIKDSSGDLSLTMQFIERTPPNFAVCQGRDDLFFPSFVIGATGAVAATANVAPDLVLEIYEAFTAGDWKRSLAAQNRLTPLRKALVLGTFPAVIKEAMEMVGMPMGKPRAPVGGLSNENRKKLRDVLISMEVLPGRGA